MDELIKLIQESGMIDMLGNINFGVATWAVPLGVCVILPVMIVWLMSRASINKDNATKAMLIAAIEKNPNLDVEMFLEKLSPKKNEKLLKEKLLTKLLWAMICLIAGLGVSALGIYELCNINDAIIKIVFVWVLAWWIALISVGIAFLINYYVGKKMLAKEIEAEERRITQQ